MSWRITSNVLKYSQLVVNYPQPPTRSSQDIPSPHPLPPTCLLYCCAPPQSPVTADPIGSGRPSPQTYSLRVLIATGSAAAITHRADPFPSGAIAGPQKAPHSIHIPPECSIKTSYATTQSLLDGARGLQL